MLQVQQTNVTVVEDWATGPEHVGSAGPSRTEVVSIIRAEPSLLELHMDQAPSDQQSENDDVLSHIVEVIDEHEFEEVRSKLPQVKGNLKRTTIHCFFS